MEEVLGESFMEVFDSLMYTYQHIPSMPGYPQGTAAGEEEKEEEEEEEEEPTSGEGGSDDDSNDERDWGSNPRPPKDSSAGVHGANVMGVASSYFHPRECHPFLTKRLKIVRAFHGNHHL